MALKIKTLAGLVNAALHIKTAGGIVPVNLHAKTADGIVLLSGGGAALTEFSFLSGLPAGFTLTRGGDDRLARNSSGQWARYSGNAPRVHHTMEGTPLGLVFERSVADKAKLGFNFVTAPTDTTGGFLTAPDFVSMTPDPASLAAEGFSAFETALRFAPDADKNWQIRHTTGNVNKHTIMGVIRDNRGSGLATMSRILMTGAANVSPPVYDEWALVSIENLTPSTTSRIGQITAVAGHNFDVAGLWLVEAPYAPLPFWRTDGLSATVADEYATAPLSGVTGWSTSGCTIYYEWFHDRPFSVDGEPLVAFVDAGASGDHIKIGGRADGTLRIEAYIGGASVFSADFAAPARSTSHVAAIRLKPGAFAAAVDGVISTVADVSPALANINTISLNKHGALVGNQFARLLSITAQQPDDGPFAASATISGGYL